MTLKPRDYKVIGYFRNDARTTLTKMSRATRIPVSTIFDKLRRFEDKAIIKRHTTLVDFKELGYDVRVQLLLEAEPGKKNPLQKFLRRHSKVNSVLRINNGYDFVAEVILKDMAELDAFTEDLEKQPVERMQQLFVMEDVKREAFLTYKENLGLVR